MKACYLSYAPDAIEDATFCHSIEDAVADFRRAAKELARYGQKIEAAIHVAKSVEDIDEYPDYVLSLGPRGGVRKASA